LPVVKGASNADALLAKVDPALRSQPVFFFMKAQQGAPDRQSGQCRKIPRSGEGQTARRAAMVVRAAHRHPLPCSPPAMPSAPTRQRPPTPPVRIGRLVEARFHAGWIAAAFLKDFKAAKGAVHQNGDAVDAAGFDHPSRVLARPHRNWRWATRPPPRRHSPRRRSTVRSIMDSSPAAQLGLKGVELRALPALGSSETAFDSH